MTPTELHRATWLPCPISEGEQVELMAPWTAKDRVLTCVQIDNEVFVIARDHHNNVTDSWKVLEDTL
jgi:hypothetical protein